MFNLNFCKKGCFFSCVFLISLNGVNVFAKEDIFDAIDKGDIKLVEKFIKSKNVVFFNREDSVNSFAQGETLLNAACYRSNFDIIKLICNYLVINNEAYCAAQYSDSIGQAFDYRQEVLSKKHGSYSSYENVGRYRTYVNKEGHGGNTPLICACSPYPEREISKYKPIDIVRYLINEGAILGIDIENEEGKTALYYAFEEGHFDVAEYLVKKGAIVTDKFVEFVKKNIIIGSGKKKLLQGKLESLKKLHEEYKERTEKKKPELKNN